MPSRADSNLALMRADAEHPWPLRILSKMNQGWYSTPTPDERRILSGYSVGLRAGEVADLLGVSASTVGYHLSNVRLKLRAKNTTHAVALALRQGWIA